MAALVKLTPLLTPVDAPALLLKAVKSVTSLAIVKTVPLFNTLIVPTLVMVLAVVKVASTLSMLAGLVEVIGAVNDVGVPTTFSVPLFTKPLALLIVSVLASKLKIPVLVKLVVVTVEPAFALNVPALFTV